MDGPAWRTVNSSPVPIFRAAANCCSLARGNSATPPTSLDLTRKQLCPDCRRRLRMKSKSIAQGVASPETAKPLGRRAGPARITLLFYLGVWLGRHRHGARTTRFAQPHPSPGLSWKRPVRCRPHRQPGATSRLGHYGVAGARAQFCLRLGGLAAGNRAAAGATDLHPAAIVRVPPRRGHFRQCRGRPGTWAGASPVRPQWRRQNNIAEDSGGRTRSPVRANFAR
jgi:hypothetical protein